jgi:hypothetical protein
MPPAVWGEVYYLADNWLEQLRGHRFADFVDAGMFLTEDLPQVVKAMFYPTIRVYERTRFGPGDTREKVEVVWLATGGWSGAEALVSAIYHNVLCSYHWEMSARGGLHIWIVPIRTAGGGDAEMARKKLRRAKTPK